jgi:hypothetical protein
MSTHEIKVVFSVIWRHSNLEWQLSEDWEWGDFPSDDLYDAFSDMLENFGTGSAPDALEGVELPENWKLESTSSAYFNESDVELNKFDIEELELVQASPINWGRPEIRQFSSYGVLQPLIVPNKFDPNEWVALTPHEQLAQLGQVDGEAPLLRSDGVIFSAMDTIYMDFYVSGQLEIAISVEAPDLESAKNEARNQLDQFLKNKIHSEILSVLPEFDGDPGFDESVSVYLAPNWVYFEK